MTKPSPPANAATAALIETLSLSRKSGKAKTGARAPGFAEALASLVDAAGARKAPPVPPAASPSKPETSAADDAASKGAPGATAKGGPSTGAAPVEAPAPDGDAALPPPRAGEEQRAGRPSRGKKALAAEDAAGEADRPGRRRSREVRKQGKARRDPDAVCVPPPGQRIDPGNTTAARRPREAATVPSEAAARSTATPAESAAVAVLPPIDTPAQAASAVRMPPADKAVRPFRAVSGKAAAPPGSGRPADARTDASPALPSRPSATGEAGGGGRPGIGTAGPRPDPAGPVDASPARRPRQGPSPERASTDASSASMRPRDGRPTFLPEASVPSGSGGGNASPDRGAPTPLRTDAAPAGGDSRASEAIPAPSAQAPSRKAAPRTEGRDGASASGKPASVAPGSAPPPGKPPVPASGAKAPFALPALERTQADRPGRAPSGSGPGAAADAGDRPPARDPSVRASAAVSREAVEASSDAQRLKGERPATTQAGEAPEPSRAAHGPPPLVESSTRRAADPSTPPSATPAPAARAEDAAPPFEQMRLRLSPLPDGVHTVEMRLSPESLGNLEIDLRIQSGMMDATVRAQTPEARELLLRDEPALRQALRDGGLTLSSFTVTVGGGGGAGERHAARTDSGGDRGARRSQKDDAVGAVAPERPTNAGRGGPDSPTHWIA